jgi:hypothetical protein
MPVSNYCYIGKYYNYILETRESKIALWRNKATWSALFYWEAAARILSDFAFTPMVLPFGPLAGMQLLARQALRSGCKAGRFKQF